MPPFSSQTILLVLKEGLKLIRDTLQVRNNLAVIVISGLNSSKEVKLAESMGLTVLKKPFNPDELNQLIDILLNGRKRRKTEKR